MYELDPAVLGRELEDTIFRAVDRYELEPGFEDVRLEGRGLGEGMFDVVDTYELDPRAEGTGLEGTGLEAIELEGTGMFELGPELEGSTELEDTTFEAVDTYELDPGAEDRILETAGIDEPNPGFDDRTLEALDAVDGLLLPDTEGAELEVVGKGEPGPEGTGLEVEGRSGDIGLIADGLALLEDMAIGLLVVGAEEAPGEFKPEDESITLLDVMPPSDDETELVTVLRLLLSNTAGRTLLRVEIIIDETELLGTTDCTTLVVERYASGLASALLEVAGALLEEVMDEAPYNPAGEETVELARLLSVEPVPEMLSTVLGLVEDGFINTLESTPIATTEDETTNSE